MSDQTNPQETSTDQPADLWNQTNGLASQARLQGIASSQQEQQAIRDKDWSFGDTLSDVAQGVGAGGEGLVKSVGKLANDASGGMLSSDPDAFKTLTQTQTLAGSLAKGITQFALAAGPVGAVAKAAGLGAGTGFLSGAARMGTTDFVAFSGDEGRFADILAKNKTLRKFGVQYLASDPDDSWATKRLKNVVEGFFLNTATHLVTSTAAKAFGVGLDRLAGRPASESVDDILKSVSPETQKAISESAEAQRYASEIKSSGANVSDDEINANLVLWHRVGQRSGRGLDGVLKGVEVRKGTTLSPDALHQGEPIPLDTPSVPVASGEAEPTPAAQDQIPLAEDPNAPQPVDVSAPKEPGLPLADPEGDGSPEPLPVSDKPLADGQLPVSEPDSGTKPLNVSTPTPDGAKGAVEFYGDHNAVISLFQTADFSTLSHESFHVWRKWWMPPELDASLSKAVGVGSEGWDEAAEEKAARLFERYLHDGTAPSEELGGIFGRAAKWMRAIYQTLGSSDIQAEVSPEVRQVFDNLLTKDGPVQPAKPVDPYTLYQRSQTPKIQNSVSPSTMEEMRQVANDSIEKGVPSDEVLSRVVDTTLNAARTGLTGDVYKTLDAVHKVVSDTIREQRGGVETLKALASKAQDFASTISDDPDKLAAFMQTHAQDADALANIRTRMAVARELYVSHAQQLSELSGKMEGAAPADFAAMKQQWMDHFLQMAQLKKADISASVEAARIPGSRRIIPFAGLDPVQASDFLDKTLGNGNGFNVRRMLREVSLAGSDPLASSLTLSKYYNAIFGGKLNALIEYRTNALISGLSTPLTKIASDVAQLALKPGERVLGGAIMRLLGQNGGDAAMKQGLGMYSHMAESAFNLFGNVSQVEGVTSPWAAGKQAFTEQSHILSGVHDPMKAISSGNLGIDPATEFGKAVDMVGNIVRLPGRTMQGITEYAQQLAYQSHIKSSAMIQAAEQGITDPVELKGFVDGQLKNSFDEFGQAKDPAALKYAMEATASMPTQGFSKQIGDAINGNPWAKLVIPFYKTPLNLFKTFVSYTPGLNMLQQEMRAGMNAADPMVRASTYGRMAVGAAFWTATLAAAGSGMITGEGPSDPKLLETMRTAGWRPHSLIFDNEDGTKTYVDYRKIEPYASVLSIAGDLAETVHLMKQDDVDGVGMAATMAIAKNMVSKTYLTGLSDFIDMLRKPDHSMAKFMGNFAGSFVPRVIGNLDPDENLRHVGGFMDGIKARLPGYASDLMPVRNALGEPVLKDEPGWSPVRWATTPDDTVARNLSEYNKGLPGAPTRIAGQNLGLLENANGQTAADRMKELVGQSQVNGRSLRDNLGRLFNSDWYKQQPGVEDPSDITNPRVRAVQQLFMQHTQAAKDQLMKEFPQLTGQAQAQRSARKSASPVNVRNILNYGS